MESTYLVIPIFWKILHLLLVLVPLSCSCFNKVDTLSPAGKGETTEHDRLKIRLKVRSEKKHADKDVSPFMEKGVVIRAPTSPT